MKRNTRANILGFCVSLMGAGVVLLLSGIVGSFTGEAESYERIYLILGIVLFMFGIAGAYQSRISGIIPPKAILSSSLIGTFTFWVVVGIAFWISGEFGTFDNILLESSSAVTVSNFSLIEDPQTLGQGLLFLRSIAQWITGFGTICFFSILLPIFVGSSRVRVGGYASHQTTQTRSIKNLKNISIIYLAVTGILLIAYAIANMSWFDALTHSWTTISTGGFSNYADGLGHFDSSAVEWIAGIGMFIGGIRFLFLWQALRGEFSLAWNSIEIRVYCLVIFFSTLVVALGDGDGVRRSFFSVTSALSGTGFHLEDWASFSAGLQVLLLILIATGTMFGTPAGGFGLTRAIEAVHYIYRELYAQLHPKAVFRVKLGRQVLGEAGLSQMQSFQLFYLGTLFLGIFFLAQFGADTISAIGGAITAFASMGPSIGDFSDPANLAELPRPARGVLSIMMLLGRISIFPLMIFLFRFWENVSHSLRFSIKNEHRK